MVYVICCDVIMNYVHLQKHRVPVQAIPCLEKWLFQEDKSELAEKWHAIAGDRRGLLIKLGLCEMGW